MREAEALRQKQEQQRREEEQRQQEQQLREAEALRQKQEQQRQDEEQRQQEQQQREAEQRRKEEEQQQQQDAAFFRNMINLFNKHQDQEQQRAQESGNEQPLHDLLSDFREHEDDYVDGSNPQNDIDIDTNDEEGRALGGPKNLIGTKKAKKLRSIQVTHVASPTQSAPRITIVETPTGRTQRTTAIPATDDKF